MMRTAVLQAPRRFEVTEQPTPRPGRGEAVVRVAGTAVCHTDLAIYTGRHPGVRYPVILGHEAAGVVEAVGPDTSIGVGARVVINPIIACGACDCCVRGDENLCRRAGLLGRELDGSLAEHLVLPERYLHPLPPGIGLEADPGWQWMQIALREHEVLGQGAVQLAAEQPGSPAEILVAPHAAVAGPAGDDRVDHHPRPDGDAALGADRLDDAGGLMPQHHRIAHTGM